MDATLLAQQAMVPQINAQNIVAFDNATESAQTAGQSAASAANALTQANAAAASAAAAALSAGAVVWVSGTNYNAGTRQTSPANGRIYRRLITGSTTTDPSLDASNYAVVQTGLGVVNVTTTAVTALPGFIYNLTNIGLTTVTLPASPLAGDTVGVCVQNGRTDNLIVRNGSLLLLDRITNLGLAEDLVYDLPNLPLNLVLINVIWRLI